MIIAIDGSAGSGKGTLAKNLSKKLNLKHLDTGVLFRIIASQAIDLGIDNEDERLKELSKKLTIIDGSLQSKERDTIGLEDGTSQQLPMLMKKEDIKLKVR